MAKYLAVHLVWRVVLYVLPVAGAVDMNVLNLIPDLVLRLAVARHQSGESLVIATLNLCMSPLVTREWEILN